MRRFVRVLAPCAAFVGIAAGCTTSYVTPGRPADFAATDRTDVLTEMDRKSAARFPARLAIARV